MSGYTGLAGYTVSTQVVNKMQYCSYPEFNMAHSGDNYGVGGLILLISATA